ncbi:MAG: prepilin-type N-terminal cleavage/methylation domain-containing protein [Mariprofundaceae bacterium]|nr:prepilin-type N-terminal cleavage/methylation domain-containing protein [Mariprofundaceae bacterium]
MNSSNEAGFTLLEVLMALTVFALIAAVCYSALGPAGEGFKQLQDYRDQLEKSSWLGKQLRADVGNSCETSLQGVRPIQVKYDARGTTYADELTLLVREAGHRGLSLVHYKLDEAKGVLIRESQMAWARQSVGVDRMELGKSSSFRVEIRNDTGQWQQNLYGESSTTGSFHWPIALRVTVVQEDKERQWILPLFLALP